MVAFCVLWALPGQPSEERPRGPSLVRSAGSSRAGVVLLRMVTAILHCGLRDRGECLLQRGAIGVGCPLDVLVGDVHPGFAHVVMSAHAAAVQTHVRLLSFDGVGDRPRPGANWLGARRRSFRDFALVCGERGENLALLPRRHLEGVEATPEFGRDLVELIRGDVQFAMGLLQPQVGAPGLRRREGERPARGLAQPQGPHELEPGQAVQLPCAPFIEVVVGRPLSDLLVLTTASRKWSTTAAMANTPPSLSYRLFSAICTSSSRYRLGSLAMRPSTTPYARPAHADLTWHQPRLILNPPKPAA